MTQSNALQRKIAELLHYCSKGAGLDPIGSVRVLRAFRHSIESGCSRTCPSCCLQVLDILNGTEDES